DTAAGIIGGSTRGIELAIPLLTSIDDRRDVATLRAVHAGEPTEIGAAQRAALEPLVSSWAAPKHYVPRITERSQSPPSSFRLAAAAQPRPRGTHLREHRSVRFTRWRRRVRPSRPQDDLTARCARSWSSATRRSRTPLT